MTEASQQEQLVLDTLAGEGELSASELSREVSIGSARLYPLLAGLEHRGAVLSRWATPDSPRKRVYYLPGRE